MFILQYTARQTSVPTRSLIRVDMSDITRVVSLQIKMSELINQWRLTNSHLSQIRNHNHDTDLNLNPWSSVQISLDTSWSDTS